MKLRVTKAPDLKLNLFECRYRDLLQNKVRLQEQSKLYGKNGNVWPPEFEEEVVRNRRHIETVTLDKQRLEQIVKLKQGSGSQKQELNEWLRSSFFESAEIVFTTLSSSGLSFFANSKTGFDTLIVDEACQAVEAAVLIPLQNNISRMVLVGDPQQLPATVISQEEGADLYQRSLFQRLQVILRIPPSTQTGGCSHHLL